MSFQNNEVRVGAFDAATTLLAYLIAERIELQTTHDDETLRAWAEMSENPQDEIDSLRGERDDLLLIQEDLMEKLGAERDVSHAMHQKIAGLADDLIQKSRMISSLSKKNLELTNRVHYLERALAELREHDNQASSHAEEGF